jgi:phospholipid transport system transporter-binding protein
MAQITQVENGWALSGDVIISTVNTLLNTSKALSLSANSSIDFTNVSDIDTSAISLILEWKRRALKEKQAVNFINLPANLTSLTALYGVAELIN